MRLNNPSKITALITTLLLVSIASPSAVATGVTLAQKLISLGGVDAGSSVNCLGTAMVGAGAMDVLINMTNNDFYLKRGCFRKIAQPIPGAVAFLISKDVPIPEYPGLFAVHHAYVMISEHRILEKANTGASWPISVEPCGNRCVRRPELTWAVYEPGPTCPITKFNQWEQGVSSNNAFYAPLQFARGLALGQMQTTWLSAPDQELNLLARLLIAIRRVSFADRFPLSGDGIVAFQQGLLEEYLGNSKFALFQYGFVSQEIIPRLVSLKSALSRLRSAESLVQQISHAIAKLRENPGSYFQNQGDIVMEDWTSELADELRRSTIPDLDFVRSEVYPGECTAYFKAGEFTFSAILHKCM